MTQAAARGVPRNLLNNGRSSALGSTGSGRDVDGVVSLLPPKNPIVCSVGQERTERISFESGPGPELTLIEGSRPGCNGRLVQGVTRIKYKRDRSPHARPVWDGSTPVFPCSFSRPPHPLLGLFIARLSACLRKSPSHIMLLLHSLKASRYVSYN